MRLLLIPGVNDADDLVTDTARWLADLDPRMRVRIIGFRRHGIRPTAVPLREPSGVERAHYGDLVRRVADLQVTVV